MPTIYKTRGNTTTVTRMTVEEIAETICNKIYMKEVAEFRSMVALERWKRRENGSLNICETEWGGADAGIQRTRAAGGIEPG